MTKPRKIAVVGAGFSGLLLALHLLRHSATTIVILVERAPEFARGLAYATGDHRHLLNVRASNMSAFPDEPGHFLAWLAGYAPGDGTPQAFVPRHLFGTYLQSLLRAMLATEDGSKRLIVVADEAVALFDRPAGFGVRLAVGRVIEVDQVVLATGNLPPHDLPALDDRVRTSDRYIRDPWAPAASAAVRPTDAVLLIGTGLTAIDVVLGLERRDHQGPIHALSRRGLAPRSHADAGPPLEPLEVPARPSVTELVKLVRRACAARDDWRSGVDGLRPHIQRLWRDASSEERRRYLRHLRPWWDVHRHRVAPTVAADVTALVASDRLSIMAGKILAGRMERDCIAIDWRPRGAIIVERMRVDRIINCTGPAGAVKAATQPLLADLVQRGRARPDPQGLGLDVDCRCRVVAADGAPSPNLFAVGPMSRGAFWEVTAVPDIRVQASALAERLSSNEGL